MHKNQLYRSESQKIVNADYVEKKCIIVVRRIKSTIIGTTESKQLYIRNCAEDLISTTVINNSIKPEALLENK